MKVMKLGELSMASVERIMRKAGAETSKYGGYRGDVRCLERYMRGYLKRIC